jgi:hypothetical protein
VDYGSVDFTNIKHGTFIHGFDISNHAIEILFSLSENNTAIVQYAVSGTIDWQASGFVYSVSGNVITFSKTQNTFDLGANISPSSFTLEISHNPLKSRDHVTSVGHTFDIVDAHDEQDFIDAFNSL